MVAVDESGPRLVDEAECRTRRTGDSQAGATVQSTAVGSPQPRERRRYRLGDFRQDLRLAVRALARKPGWTAAGVLTLALGVAGSTLVLGLLDRAFLRPLDFGDGRELVTLYVTSGPEYSPLSYPDYGELRTALEGTVDLAAFCRVFMTVAGGAFPERHEGEMVSGAFFSVLGVRPALGRLIGPADNVVPGGHRLVVLSDFLWRSQFAADPEIVGRTVRLNEDVYDVIGVVPAGFRGAVWPSFESAFWIPAMMADDYFSGRDVLNGRSFAVFQTLGRLAPGTPLEAVQARIDPVDEVLARDRGASAYYPETGAPWRVHALPASYLRLWPEYRDEVAGFLGILGLMAAAALAVACANLATLLLARSTEWRHELAIRRALGAAWADLVRRLGMEVAVLVAAGGLGAAALVVWSSALAPLLPLTVPYQLDLVPDLRVLGIGLAVTAVTGCAFAVPAVWRVLRGLPGLSAMSRTYSAAGRSTAMSGLVVAQVAVSTVLVVGCGLLVRSAWNTQRIDQGFDAPRGASLRVAFPRAWEDDPDRANAATDRLLDGLRSESLVTAASASTRRPGDVPAPVEVRLAGSRRVGPETPVETNVNAVTGDYFDTFGIPVRSGRVFGRADAVAGAPVAVVSQALAALHFSPRNPVGQTLRLPGEEGPRRIVAVVGDTAGRDVRLAPPPTVYVPYRQRPQGGAYVTVRARGGAADESALLRRRARELDPAIAVSEAATFAELRRAATRESRVHAGLAATAAGLALSLALVGLYGLMGYVVRRREREIGIRIALGATRAHVHRLVVGGGCRLTVLGLVLGLAASIGASRLLSPLLYGVGPGDAPTFAVVPALFLLAAVVACLGPALHATRVNPTDVLRAE